MRDKKLVIGLAVILAGLLIAGAAFIVSTLRGQSSASDRISLARFAAYETEYGLSQGNNTAQAVLDTQIRDGEITGEAALEALAEALPEGGTLVSAERSEDRLTVDYARQENDVYTGRVVLTYDRQGLLEISIREEDEIITVNRDGQRETVRVS